MQGQPAPRAALDPSPEAVNRLTPLALWLIKQILFLIDLPFHAKKIGGGEKVQFLPVQAKLAAFVSCYYGYLHAQSSIAPFNG